MCVGMRGPGSLVSPRRRGGDDSSGLEARYIPKENEEQAQIQRYDSGCVHGWRGQEGRRRGGSLVPAQWKLGSLVLDSLGVRLGLGELLCFCAPRSHQKKCVLRSGVRTREESAWPRETRPHGRAVEGFPKHFNVTDIHTDADHRAGGGGGGGWGIATGHRQGKSVWEKIYWSRRSHFPNKPATIIDNIKLL